MAEHKHGGVALAQEVLRRVLPETRRGDHIYSFAHFVMRNRRLPSRRAMRFNDVLYRLKISGEILDPLRVFVSDKAQLKDHVTAVLGPGHVVETFALLDSPEAVADFDFPPRCCIKPTHASGAVILREAGEPVDRDAIASWFTWRYYEVAREANYKSLRPRVIVEALAFDRTDPADYKLFCYNGTPRVVMVDTDRFADHRRALFTPDWTPLPFSINYPPAERPPERPANLAAMLEGAARLAADFRGLVRIDLYSDGQRFVVGEITNLSGNAGGRMMPPGPETEAAAARAFFGESADQS